MYPQRTHYLEECCQNSSCGDGWWNLENDGTTEKRENMSPECLLAFHQVWGLFGQPPLIGQEAAAMANVNENKVHNKWGSFHSLSNDVIKSIFRTRYFFSCCHTKESESINAFQVLKGWMLYGSFYDWRIILLSKWFWWWYPIPFGKLT
jgi:hypothetical protein